MTDNDDNKKYPSVILTAIAEKQTDPDIKKLGLRMKDLWDTCLEIEEKLNQEKALFTVLELVNLFQPLTDENCLNTSTKLFQRYTYTDSKGGKHLKFKYNPKQANMSFDAILATEKHKTKKAKQEAKETPNESQKSEPPSGGSQNTQPPSDTI